MPRKPALPLMLCLFFTPLARAEIYRWVDADGSIHFSDTRPLSGHHAPVQVGPLTTMPMAENIGQSKRVTQSRQEVGKLLAPENKHRFAASQQAQKARAEQCQQYRRQLNRLQARLREGYSNEKGNSLRQKRRKVSQAYGRECVLN